MNIRRTRDFTCLSVMLAAAATLAPSAGSASSHSDAPLIKQDPQANLTDVYAFIGTKYDDPGQRVLNVLVSVRPFSEPGDGVTYDRFADDALYSIHPITSPVTGVTLDRYDFRFSSVTAQLKNPGTILSYGLGTELGPINSIGDARRNFTQTYAVYRNGSLHPQPHPMQLHCLCHSRTEKPARPLRGRHAGATGYLGITRAPCRGLDGPGCTEGLDRCEDAFVFADGESSCRLGPHSGHPGGGGDCNASLQPLGNRRFSFQPQRQLGSPGGAGLVALPPGAERDPGDRHRHRAHRRRALVHLHVQPPSNFDIPVLLGHLPVQFRWLAKAELFRIHLFGRAMCGAGYISIDRSDRAAAFESLQQAAEKIRQGVSILIFPEGTRSLDGSLKAFKKGGFVMAIRSGVPIVPVAVRGTYDIMPKHSVLIRPRPVAVDIGEPIAAQGIALWSIGGWKRQSKQKTTDRSSLRRSSP